MGAAPGYTGVQDVTKPYEFIGFGAMDVTKPYEFIGFGAMDVTKPYEFIGFGAMDVTKPYKFIAVGLPGFPGAAGDYVIFKGIPKSCYWPSVFLEAWGTKANKLQIFQKRVVCWPCRLRRQGQKHHSFLEMCGLFGPWYPRPPNNHMANKNISGSLRI